MSAEELLAKIMEYAIVVRPVAEWPDNVLVSCRFCGNVWQEGDENWEDECQHEEDCVWRLAVEYLNREVY
jgi:predicted metal-binding protein